MGTSADIGRLNDDGTYNVFHISNDGYLSSAGAKLFKHYQTAEARDKMFAKTGSPSLEADPDKMRDNHWHDGETVNPEWLTYLFRDGAWHYCEEEYETKPMMVTVGRGDTAREVMQDVSRPTGKSTWVPITREMLIADDPHVVEYLDFDGYEPSVMERIESDFAMKMLANTDPNVKYSAGNGVFMVQASYGGGDEA